jgi:hypothetical protein
MVVVMIQLMSKYHVILINIYTGCLQRNAQILLYRMSTMKHYDFRDVLKIEFLFQVLRASFLPQEFKFPPKF